MAHLNKAFFNSWPSRKNRCLFVSYVNKMADMEERPVAQAPILLVPILKKFLSAGILSSRMDVTCERNLKGTPWIGLSNVGPEASWNAPVCH